MGWEQFAILFLYFSSFGILVAKYGEEKTGYHNWTDMVGFPIVMGLLWSGGFFS